MNVDVYLDELLSINKRVSGSCYIWNFTINPSQLIQILSAYKKNKDLIWFSQCRLETDYVVDFGDELEGFNSKGISLWDCGSADRSDWGNHPERFSNIIEGLGNAKDVRDNLKKINLTDCKMERSKVQEILKKHGFSKNITYA